jgi:hypothetical protein
MALLHPRIPRRAGLFSVVGRGGDAKRYLGRISGMFPLGQLTLTRHSIDRRRCLILPSLVSKLGLPAFGARRDIGRYPALVE